MTTTTAEHQLRHDIEPPPSRMRSLSVYRGYPVPWFVAWIDGVPEFRVADGEKFHRAIRDKLCWVCGEPLGRMLAFVIGPMCGINRTTAEPPCHYECAVYSAKNCPFLSRPQMVRRENGIPDGAENPGGELIRRNPGVTLIWVTRSYELFGDGAGKVLIQVGDPESVEWLAEGKPATRTQVEYSVATGLQALEELAKLETGAMGELHRRRASLERLYPSS